MDFMTVAKPGINITTGATSANSALPTSLSGAAPGYVRVSATANARIALGTSGVAAVAADLMVQPGDAVILAIPRGITHIAAIQDTAAGVVNVSPLEN